MKSYHSIIILLFLLISTAARADFNDGVIAYLTGDYDKAFTTMQSLGEVSNHDYAQYYLGMMYMKGQGVTQDYKKASEWFRKAAEQNVPQAQYKLGDLYFNGRGVPKDYEFAYIWFKVGASHGHGLSKNAVDKAKQKLSQTELSEAEKIITSHIKKYGPKKDVDPSQPSQVDNE